MEVYKGSVQEDKGFLILTLDIIFWRLCDNFKLPKIKSISQIYNTKTFQKDLSHISLKI